MGWWNEHHDPLRSREKQTSGGFRKMAWDEMRFGDDDDGDGDNDFDNDGGDDDSDDKW